MSSALWLVALAPPLVAPPVASQGTVDAGETNSTTQTGTEQRHIPERHLGVPLAGDKCDCLNWKDLFDLGRVWCGEGNEYFSYKNKTGVSKMDLMMVAADTGGALHQN